MGRRDEDERGDDMTRTGDKIPNERRRTQRRDETMGRVTRGERKGDCLVNTNGLNVRAIELTQRAAPANQRTNLDLLKRPTGCVSLLLQAAHVGDRLYAGPEHHPDDHLLLKRPQTTAWCFCDLLTSTYPRGPRRAKRQAPGHNVMLSQHLARRCAFEDPVG